MIAGLDRRFQLLPVGQLSSQRSRHRKSAADAQRDPRPDHADPAVRLRLRHPFGIQPHRAVRGELHRPLRDPERHRRRGRLHRQWRQQLRRRQARPEPARNHALRGGHLSICGRHAELSDRAVRPLLADQVHARSQSRRHHLQRLRRRRAAVEPRGRVQADASHQLGSAHTLRFGVFFQNEHTTSKSSPRFSRWTPTATRPATFRSPSSTRAARPASSTAPICRTNGS